MRTEGAKVRAARVRRHWRQTDLARRVDLSQPTISSIERGEGATLSLVAWQRIADAFDLSLTLKLGRDRLEETRDAGHLAMQELVLRLGRRQRVTRTFELRSAGGRWTDVGLADHASGRLVLVECVNVIQDIGSAIRASDRKLAEAESLAVALGPDRPRAVHACWVVRSTRRNRHLVARYPELFATRFPGSSRAWVAALTAGASPPAQRGRVWCDVAATRVFAWRRASRQDARILDA
jgi:transcriptional regulator with XRE-family HTH domain